MSDGALSKKAMLAGLEDIRLPADAAGGLVAELAVAIGLAALLAALLLFFAHAFRMIRPPKKAVSLEEEISGLKALPDVERRIRLLHLLKKRAPERYSAFRQAAALYQPGGGPDSAELEAELRAHG